MIKDPPARLRAGALAIVAVGVITGCGGSGTSSSERSSGLAKVSSGLLADYSFNTPEPLSALQQSFELGGSAPAAHARVSVRSDGLHVGVIQHAPGVFEGYFAVTRSSYPAGAIFHVRMSRLGLRTVTSSQTTEAVFAVQTANTKRTGAINYVLVASVRQGPLVHWELGFAEGHLTNATTKILWASPSLPSTQTALGEDITLRTDGYRSYRVYFGARLVYSSDQLRMDIVPPFQAYLEVQALGAAYQSRFQDFWVVRSNTVQVRGLASGTQVSLAPNGQRAVSATANQAGIALLNLAPPQAQGVGTLTITQHGVARTFTGVQYAGGDVYRVHS